MSQGTGRDIDIATIGEELKLLEGLRTTRAIRRLLPDPVPPALIRKVCEAATYAPSGGNRQPWKFIAVTEPERKRWVATRYRQGFMAYIAPALQAAQSADYPERKRRNQASAVHLAEHMADVPVLLFVAGFTRRGQTADAGALPVRAEPPARVPGSRPRREPHHAAPQLRRRVRPLARPA